MHSRGGAWACLFLSLIGLALSGYMYFIHLGLLRGELLGGAACGGSGLFNCHAVAASPWGTALGLPLPLWGLIGYLITLTLAALALALPAAAAEALALLLAAGVAFLLIDAALLAVMVTQIRSLCLLCFGTYLVNALLAIGARAGLGLQWGEAFKRIPAALKSLDRAPQSSLLWLTAGAAALGLAAVSGAQASVQLMSQSNPVAIRQQLREFMAHQTRASVALDQDPELGRAQNAIHVVEFSDFLCPVCQRASKLNHIMLTTHRDDVPFVFKNFPLDLECNPAIGRMVHPGACAIAAAAECAHRQGRFWPLHDRIFEQGRTYNPAQLRDDAAKTGLDVTQFDACMGSGEGMEAVRRDVAEGQRLGVASTPTHFINGYRLTGIMPPSFFQELARVLREGP